MVPKKTTPAGVRSITIGGNAMNSVILAGDHNTASVALKSVSLPRPESVNIATEIAALRELLSRLQAPDQKKVDNAAEESHDEATKPSPASAEVGKGLERALEYAKKAAGFTEMLEKLRPHVIAAVGWLGPAWHNILHLVGLSS